MTAAQQTLPHSPDGEHAAVSPEAILQLGLGFWASKTLLSAVELGVFTELAGGPLSGEELSGRLALHPRAWRDFFDALEMIKKEPKKSFEIMGADVKQSGEAFEGSAKYLRWQDRAANQKFFSGEHAAFSKEAAELLMEAGIIKQLPDMSKLADTRFLK